MNLKAPFEIGKYIKEIDEALEERYKSAKQTAEAAKNEIREAVDFLKTLPKDSNDLLVKSIAFWIRDFSLPNQSYREYDVGSVYIRFGDYSSGATLEMKGDVNRRFASEKNILANGDYRALVIILPK